MGNLSSVVVSIDWLDQELQKMYKDRECQLLFEKATSLKR